MAELKIEFLVARPNKNGPPNWYWQPSKKLRDAGWEPTPLGNDQGKAAIAAMQINEAVEEWRQGAALPDIKIQRQKGTLGAAIDDYEREWVNGTKPNGKPRLADSTIATYTTALRRLERWAGKQPLEYITRRRVAALRDGMLRTGMGETAVHTTLKLGRQLFVWLIDQERWEQGKNPFERFGMAQPDGRDVVWSPAARELIVQTADDMGFHSVALAVMLGYAIGQREGDLLGITIPKWVQLPAHKMQPQDYEVLSADAEDGIPRGIRIQQNKTGAWIEVPVVGEVRQRVEANIVRAKEAGRFELILDDTRRLTNRRTEKGDEGKLAAYTGSTGATRFQRDFAEIREAAAIAAEKRQDEKLAGEIRLLQFRDLRRTCVVYLGELGLEDHLIAAITGHDIDETRRILKIYMPRTTGRAATAIAIATAREAANKEKQA